jgi:DNA repair protein RadD
VAPEEVLGPVFALRPYQRHALEALETYWQSGGGNPLLALATATGKSLLIAWLIHDLLARFPNLRILVLVHVQELLDQNLEHLLALWPAAPVGINCAAFDRRDWDQQIIFASIQSVFRSPERLGARDLVLIDECHLVPHDGAGMYRSLLDTLRDIAPDMRVCGLSATPFRLDSGRLDEGDGKIFDDVIYTYDIARGIADGWLSSLSSKATRTTIDVGNVGQRGGEFIAAELEAAVDDETKIAAACDEIVQLSADRKCWLVFCCGISHAMHVRDALRDRGVSCEAVFGETPQDERERIIAEFRARRIRCLVNVMVLTTGFDVPGIDLLVMLRPTLSTGLYVQQIGRGTRKAEGKTDCLVLDFARNVYRHGPVDRISIATTGKSNGNGTGVKVNSVKAKECPDCGELNALASQFCVQCGYEFSLPRPLAKHATTADAVPILSEQQAWLPVHDLTFHKHVKFSDPDAPPTLRVEYLCGLSLYSDYVAFEHRGRARTFAERFWFAHGGKQPVPATVDEALQRVCELDRAYEITVVRNGKFWNVTERRVQRADDQRVEIDRFYQTWTINSRANAATTLKQTPINDAVPY